MRAYRTYLVAAAPLFAISAVLFIALSVVDARSMQRQTNQSGNPRMVEFRIEPTVTLLADGRVLVTGGRSQAGPVLQSAEVYDPVLGTWSATGDMAVARLFHTATLLTDGRVLVTGGGRCDGPCIGNDSTDTAELYDPQTGAWTFTGAMIAPRSRHAAVRLADGRVLVAGGVDRSTTAPSAGFGRLPTPTLDSAEIYDPLSGTWTPVSPMPNRRQGQAGVLLADGRVLMLGGSDLRGTGADFGRVRATGDIFDPLTGSWTTTARRTCSDPADDVVGPVSVEANGAVLLLGGYYLEWLLRYDPMTNTWSCRELTGRGNHRWANPGAVSVVTLVDERLLATGGVTPDTLNQTTAEASILDPTADAWTPTTAMGEARSVHSAIRLTDGRVLVFGGLQYELKDKIPTLSKAVLTSEVYDPVVSNWSPR